MQHQYPIHSYLSNNHWQDALSGEGHGEARHDHRMEVHHLGVHVQWGDGTTGYYNTLESF